MNAQELRAQILLTPLLPATDAHPEVYLLPLPRPYRQLLPFRLELREIPERERPLFLPVREGHETEDLARLVVKLLLKGPQAGDTGEEADHDRS